MTPMFSVQPLPRLRERCPRCNVAGVTSWVFLGNDPTAGMFTFAGAARMHWGRIGSR